MMRTIKDLLSSDVSDIGGHLYPLWQWWTGEIWSLVPLSIRRILAPSKKYLIVDFVEEKLVSRTPLARPFDRRQETKSQVADRLVPHADAKLDGTIVSLPPSELLRLRARYPRTSQSNLRTIIARDLPRLCPLNVELVRFGFTTMPRSGTGAELQDVEIWIGRRQTIERIVQLCEQLQLNLVGVTQADLAPEYSVTNILPRHKRSLKSNVWSLRLPLLAATAACLAISVAFVAQVGDREFSAKLERELVRKRVIVQAIEKDRAQIERLERRRDFLLRQRQSMQAGQILSELARILPDDSWTYNLELAKDGLRIRGFARRANELIPALDSSPVFSGAQFRSPVVGAPGGADRFDISVKTGGGQ